MYTAQAHKTDGAPMLVTLKQVESLPPLYRCLAQLLLEQNTGELVLIDEGR